MRYILLILIFASCSPQKRMQRLLKKHPHLISVVDMDTVIRDTIHELDTFITESHTDTFYLPSNDTTVETERIIVEKWRNRFTVQIKPDTLIQKDTVFWEKKVTVRGKVVEVVPKWIYLIIAFIVFLFLYNLDKRFR